MGGVCQPNSPDILCYNSLLLVVAMTKPWKSTAGTDSRTIIWLVRRLKEPSRRFLSSAFDVRPWSCGGGPVYRTTA